MRNENAHQPPPRTRDLKSLLLPLSWTILTIAVFVVIFLLFAVV